MIRIDSFFFFGGGGFLLKEFREKGLSGHKK